MTNSTLVRQGGRAVAVAIALGLTAQLAFAGLVLADSHGRTIIAEIPDPTCVAHISPVKTAIRTARAHMDAHYSVTGDFKATNQRVVVRGVGFFDYYHGQTGMAPFCQLEKTSLRRETSLTSACLETSQ